MVPMENDNRREKFSLTRLRDLIHRWSRRIQYIRLDARDIRPLELDVAEFPQLRSASFGYDDDTRAITLFANAPCFHALDLQFEGFRRSRLALPWLQLTKFEGALWLELFTLAPNLSEVTCTYDPNPGDVVAITHRNLRSLTIRSSADILRHLILPALGHLAVAESAAAPPPASSQWGLYSDTISAHLLRLARAGMDIYSGTEDKNYALIASDTALLEY
ncbi:hypothetical protein K438DRAFT_1956080 [Mycena galopus ATCC 62051]|nr:hypothetical protein K438DRAFT_1956080 [Mycena galopus ATCC 62051]